jgi:hypothetical protein
MPHVALALLGLDFVGQAMASSYPSPVQAMVTDSFRRRTVVRARTGFRRSGTAPAGYAGLAGMFRRLGGDADEVAVVPQCMLQLLLPAPQITALP